MHNTGALVACGGKQVQAARLMGGGTSPLSGGGRFEAKNGVVQSTIRPTYG